MENLESKLNDLSGPTYYGEIPWFANILKTLISIVSILVFLITLFSEEHDVKGFYNELLIFISPIGINLFAIYASIRNNQFAHTTLFKVAVVCASICFIVSLSILLLSGQNIVVLEKYLTGSFWKVTILMFPFIIIPFIVDIIRPISPVEKGIKKEPRE